jgi:hypothetical protein
MLNILYSKVNIEHSRGAVLLIRNLYPPSILGRSILYSVLLCSELSDLSVPPNIRFVKVLKSKQGFPFRV